MSTRAASDETEVRIDASKPAYAYDAALRPAAKAASGTIVVFETADARNGALAGHPPGSAFVLPPPTGRSNPLTGPLAITDLRPGDALAVQLLTIRCGSPGWAGAHAHVNPLEPGRIPISLGRSCAIEPDRIRYTPTLDVPLRPMIGCIGTAPADRAPGAGEPGRFGGNLDHSIITEGSTLYLPVAVDGGYLFIGDAHAAQGDGELSGTAVEVPAEVTVRVEAIPAAAPEWPWIVTRDRIAVLTSASDFPDARREAVEAMVDLIEQRLGLQPAEALGLISAAGDLRIGQAFGGMYITLRLELPRFLGLELISTPGHPEPAR